MAGQLKFASVASLAHGGRFHGSKTTRGRSPLASGPIADEPHQPPQEPQATAIGQSRERKDNERERDADGQDTLHVGKQQALPLYLIPTLQERGTSIVTSTAPNGNPRLWI